VTIKLKNAPAVTLQQRFPKGSAQVPMALEERLSKFRACTRATLSAGSTDRALGYIDKLETMTSIRPLTALLGG
jgi:hypothetical protein